MATRPAGESLAGGAPQFEADNPHESAGCLEQVWVVAINAFFAEIGCAFFLWLTLLTRPNMPLTEIVASMIRGLLATLLGPVGKACVCRL